MNFKKILLAVDASENAMRAVEYVGSIAGNSDGFEVRLLCIERLPHRDIFPDEESWKEGCETTRNVLKEFLGKARERLVEMGVPGAMVTEKYVTSCFSPFSETAPVCSRGTGVAHEILDAQKQGGYGTVVIGRRGVAKAEEFLFGSVSNKIVHSAKDCTVWVVS
ncbi:universal stress protein [Pseudodesulfovibrio sp. zrk46]|uniref:universal stress protein n=1 Tax=Pseudodesulfovibrio sp. zrk46 TaxID=2725288 RepID=UPI0014492782|nr:universal stress protein [Pseudodesulfovibrio sp. zrk46]QJB55223.1 universal stress protein [Pseudodesulfovibrio sp. zrk46]